MPAKAIWPVGTIQNIAKAILHTLVYADLFDYPLKIEEIHRYLMVSITGALVMNNVSSPQDDIDLLIVTTRNRVWLARGLVILIVHLARNFGVEIYLNYVLAEHRFELSESSPFTAHEPA